MRSLLPQVWDTEETDENETDFEDMDGLELEDDHGDIQNSAS